MPWGRSEPQGVGPWLASYGAWVTAGGVGSADSVEQPRERGHR